MDLTSMSAWERAKMDLEGIFILEVDKQSVTMPMMEEMSWYKAERVTRWVVPYPFRVVIARRAPEIFA
jgi:hypothetical protein